MLSKFLSLAIASTLVISSIGFKSPVIAQEINKSSIDQKSSSIKWYSYDEGVKLAKEQNKHIIVDFYTDWCPYCKLMDETYTDKQVIDEINKNFIAIKINCESNNIVDYNGQKITEEKLANKLGVNSYPTTLFFNENNNYIDGVHGLLKPNQIKIIAEYIGTQSYRTHSPSDYADKYFKKV